ncbi:MAG: hypothetical protein WC980_07005 [Candidatus Brocadiia bacterium]
MSEKVFKVKCPECGKYMTPVPMSGFEDRIKFICLNRPCCHTPVIKLLRKGVRRNYAKFHKGMEKAIKNHDYFLMAMNCQIRGYVDDAKSSDCAKCPRTQKQMCTRISALAWKLCGFERMIKF